MGWSTLSLMLYRDVLAERRRLHGEAPWQLTGVVVRGTWSPAAKAISPPDVRQIEAGLVEVVRLPAFLAPDDQSAVGVAVVMAGMAGYGGPGTELLWSRSGWHEISTEIG
jgi:hypothetical protein